LAEEVPLNHDFLAATAGAVATSTAQGKRLRLHCAELSKTRHRQWVRLVGTEIDVQLWTAPDEPQPSPYGLWDWLKTALTPLLAWAEALLRSARELPFGSGLSLVAMSEAEGWVRLSAQAEDGVREVLLWRAGCLQVKGMPLLSSRPPRPQPDPLP